MWDLIVSVHDHRLSFYFSRTAPYRKIQVCVFKMKLPMPRLGPQDHKTSPLYRYRIRSGRRFL